MRIFAISIIALALLLSVITPVSATNYYETTYKVGAHGVKADIYTPSSAPIYYNWQGESSWVNVGHDVSETERYWMQTGWLYYSGSGNAADTYLENHAGSSNELMLIGTQSWGSYKNYKIQYDSENDEWDAYIDGTWEGSNANSGMPNPPADDPLLVSLRFMKITELR